MNKPQTFAITSQRPKLLEAIRDDLLNLGYVFKVKQTNIETSITNSSINPKSYNDFKTLTHSISFETLEASGRTFFQLPEQYLSALSFAEEQLNKAKEYFNGEDKILEFFVGTVKQANEKIYLIIRIIC